MRSKTQSRLQRIKYMELSGYTIRPDGKVEHREIYKRAHGSIPKNWVVHHIDHDKKNNKVSNLIAMPEKLHNKMHNAARKAKCIFTRSQIEPMISAYNNLHNKKSIVIEFKVIVDQEQLTTKEVIKEPSVNMNEYFARQKRSGSSLYR